MPTFKAAYLIHGDDHGRIAERRTRLRAMAEAEAGTAGVEVYEGDSPTARVFAFRLDEQGRKHIDPETGDVAMEPPHDLVLSSLPPVQPGRA